MSIVLLINVDVKNLPFFEALASETRIKIINLLANEDLNIKDLSEKIGISSPIILKHVKKLEDANIITTRLVKLNGSIHKICTLLTPEYRINMPFRHINLCRCHELNIPVGNYSIIEAGPTCGLASEIQIIGYLDDPRYFYDPLHITAQIIWFSEGFVEYNLPNYLSPVQEAREIEISFEISSEAPDINENWPSDISIFLNGIKLLTYTSPGDYGLKCGLLTPKWWKSNQHGNLKTIHIRNCGTYLDDTLVSDVTLIQVIEAGNYLWRLRFESRDNAVNAGGLTLFGEQFGNHAQNILVRTFYTLKN